MKPLRTAILGYGRSGSTLHAGPIGDIHLLFSTWI
jgi:hypothetical protein